MIAGRRSAGFSLNACPGGSDDRLMTALRTSLTDRDRSLLLQLFGIDTRALAVMRIGVSLILLFDVVVGTTVDGDRFVTVALLPVALMLLVGYRSRIAVVACWLIYGWAVRERLLYSDGIELGRYITTLLLFWSMFLPIGDQFSVDRARSGGRAPVTYLSVASAGLLIQVFLIYFTAGITKDFGQWVFDPIALETILGFPHHATEIGQALTDFPRLLAVGSVATILLEIVGPILLFVPGRGFRLRRIALVAVFIGFHVGMIVLLKVELLPYALISAWLVFLPAPVWDRLAGGRVGESAPLLTRTDRHRVRNAVAGVALLIVVVSNVISVVAYPTIDGPLADFQRATQHVALFQQWLMFSVPTSVG